MGNVKRYDCTNGGAKFCDGCYQMTEAPLGDYVRAEDYDALEAEAQALREEVARGNRITCAMALDLGRVGEALGIPGMEQEGGADEFIDVIQELQEELDALRARMVVVPGRIPSNGPKEEWYLTGWNACLDELARINGKAVSEGLLRRVEKHLRENVFAPFGEPLPPEHKERADLAEELRALLGEGKES